MEFELKKFYDNCVMNKPGRLEYLANYLTDLFVEYKNKYSKELGCPQIKIQIMILILQAYYVLEYGRKTKIENIDKIIVYYCGFKLPNMLIPYNITSAKEYSNKPLCLTSEQYEYLLSINLSNNFFNDNQFKLFTEEQREIILKLFDYFGDYNPRELGKILDTVKPSDNQLSEITLDEYQDWVLKAYENDTISSKFFDFINFMEG